MIILRNKYYSEEEDKGYEDSVNKKVGSKGKKMAIGGAIGGTGLGLAGYKAGDYYGLGSKRLREKAKKYGNEEYEKRIKEILGDELVEKKKALNGRNFIDGDNVQTWKKEVSTFFNKFGSEEEAKKLADELIKKGRYHPHSYNLALEEARDIVGRNIAEDWYRKNGSYELYHNQLNKYKNRSKAIGGIGGAAIGLTAGALIGKKVYDKNKRQAEEKIRKYREASEDNKKLMRG